MRAFSCTCGSEVFFDSTVCLSCRAPLGYDWTAGKMATLQEQAGEVWRSACGREYKLCKNTLAHQNCNWLIPAEFADDLCFSCQFNRRLPDLSHGDNLRRWGKFEKAKRRLLCTLLDLGLPLVNRTTDAQHGLLFDFVEDARSNPNVPSEDYVMTGHGHGVITINTLEADDVEREKTRVEMGERYRTLLGHLRHESGHYYYDKLGLGGMQAQFSDLFGDPTQDYKAALERHYKEGPAANWQERHISSYASVHPLEDWAETWGHYLLIHDALQTAYSRGFLEQNIGEMTFIKRVQMWSALSSSLNELCRASGVRDMYPFVINDNVQAKLLFVGRVIDGAAVSSSQLTAAGSG